MPEAVLEVCSFYTSHWEAVKILDRGPVKSQVSQGQTSCVPSRLAAPAKVFQTSTVEALVMVPLWKEWGQNLPAAQHKERSRCQGKLEMPQGKQHQGRLPSSFGPPATTFWELLAPSPHGSLGITAAEKYSWPQKGWDISPLQVTSSDIQDKCRCHMTPLERSISSTSLPNLHLIMSLPGGSPLGLPGNYSWNEIHDCKPE